MWFEVEGLGNLLSFGLFLSHNGKSVDLQLQRLIFLATALLEKFIADSTRKIPVSGGRNGNAKFF